VIAQDARHARECGDLAPWLGPSGQAAFCREFRQLSHDDIAEYEHLHGERNEQRVASSDDSAFGPNLAAQRHLTGNTEDPARVMDVGDRCQPQQGLGVVGLRKPSGIGRVDEVREQGGP
jgi:hypothetical protein